METELQRGQIVRVNAFGGKRPTVIVVEDRGNVVLVCKPEEYERALNEQRDPISVGFHREDILEKAGHSLQ
jgi:hypothetical protein